MASPNVTTSPKSHKRIMPETPVAVTIPDQGNVNLFYKGQIFTPGQEGSIDGIYRSMYLDGSWKGGLDTPPICPILPADPSRVTAISWSKQEQRIYYIDNDRFIQELCYSGSQGDQWFPGALQNTLKVRAQSGSSLAAVHWYDGERNSCIRVFYQAEGDSESSLQTPIKELRWTTSDNWHMGSTLVYALPGCGIAAVTYPFNDQQRIHLFYQSLELTLSEVYYHQVHDTWLPGEKNLGIAGDSTPITAFAWIDGEVQDMQVYWRNKVSEAELVGARKHGRHYDFPNWMPIDPVIGGLSFDDQFAVVQWGHSKHMRLYYTSDKVPLLELCNDGAGWVPGAKFGDGQ